MWSAEVHVQQRQAQTPIQPVDTEHFSYYSPQPLALSPSLLAPDPFPALFALWFPGTVNTWSRPLGDRIMRWPIQLQLLLPMLCIVVLAIATASIG